MLSALEGLGQAGSSMLAWLAKHGLPSKAVLWHADNWPSCGESLDGRVDMRELAVGGHLWASDL